MPKTILVIDDEPDIAQLLQVNFKQEGYTVETAEDGMQGLEKVAAMQPDLILVDEIMPQMTGLEVLRQLKQNHSTSRIPVVMLSAKGSQEDMDAGWRAGIDLYLTKPFALSELKDIVASILN